MVMRCPWPVRAMTDWSFLASLFVVNDNKPPRSRPGRPSVDGRPAVTPAATPWAVRERSGGEDVWVSAGIQIPAGFLAYAARGPEWASFLDRLPALLRELLEDWQLVVDGEPTHGYAAVVVPVRTTGGRPAALKVGWPHEEAEHEHLALQHWRGDGAVLLLRADPRRFAMLLERLHAEDLAELWDVEGCEV